MPPLGLGQSGAAGTNPYGGGYPYYATFNPNPFTMSSLINEPTSNGDMLATRVHRQAIKQDITTELWYYRDFTWTLFPQQPLTEYRETHPYITQTYKQPSTLNFELRDPEGLLTPDNMESPYNYDISAAFDPLIDEARKICFRAGVFCWGNIAGAGGASATFSITPTSGYGTTADLTDGVLTTGAGPASSLVNVFSVSNDTLDIEYDLVTAQPIKHAVVRFVQQDGVMSSILPSSMIVSISNDNVNWTPYTASTIADDTTNNIPGDWQNTPDGSAVEVSLCDINVVARYVKFSIFSSGTGNLLIDELSIYGGSTGSVIGLNMFTGYLGDQIDIGNDGHIVVTCTDVTKKMSDNNECRLTPVFTLVDTADIMRGLLQSATIWDDLSPYQAPWTDAELGWVTAGVETGLVYPQYQGQTNNVYGYVSELVNSIGWYLYADGSGVMQMFEPPYQQYQPSRVMIAGLNGNNDVRSCLRHRTGKEMRNTVEVSSAGSTTGFLGTLTFFEPNSRLKYGSRRTVITDPILNSSQLMTKTASYFLRDYAWRLQTLDAEINPDFDTQLKQVHAFRAPARPNLYVRNSAFTGYTWQGEMWIMKSLTQHFTPSEWWGEANYHPYFPLPTASPQIVSVTPGSGTPNPILSMEVAWNALTDPHAVGIDVYVSTASENGPFNLVVSGLSPTSTSYLITTSDGSTPLVLGGDYWVYLTAVGDDGLQSYPSVVIEAEIGGTASYSSCWTVTDFAFGLIDRSGPDSGGVYSYHFQGTWTAPSCGFKRMAIYLNPLVQPSPSGDPLGQLKSSWALYNNTFEWHGNFIAAGFTWDGKTPGELSWDIYIRSTYNFTTGQRMYARIFTSSATTRWREWGGDSDFNGWPGNVAYAVFP